MSSSRKKTAAYCAPHADTASGACLTLQYLKLVARLWNQHHPGRKQIKLTNVTKEQLLRDITRVTQKPEHELPKLPFIPQDVRMSIADAFRPQRPSSWNKNPYQWLTNEDIEAVMQQYEKRYPTFRFLGVFPIDFAQRNAATGTCIEERMCKLDVREVLMQKRIKKIGIVFNLDKHNQRGSHWVALFIGLDSRKKCFGAYYYDSVASPPPAEVQEFMKRVASQAVAAFGVRVGRKFELAHNRVRRQFKNSECGVFSMYYLSKMVEATSSFEDVCKSIGSDAEMNASRAMFYRPT